MKKQSQWTVIATERFNLWLLEQTEDVRQSVFASLNNLKMYGYQLSRPYADTIKGSKYPNMKELRIQHKSKPLRAFFAFDPLRQAIVLCAGNKSNDKQFYERMIEIADAEVTDYLQSLEQ